MTKRKPVRALLIDPHASTVTEHPVLDLASIKALIGDVTVAGHGLPDGHMIYVDDEGLINGTLEGFLYPPAGQPLMGNGLIVGPADANGNDTDCTYDPHDIAAAIYGVLDIGGVLAQLPVTFAEAHQ